ncbi:MAG: biopolymer transporter ExbD [Alkalinema sp. FL-bin-369]|nr:biopolymer transporter ExbD [Leptolyngbyaceae cyanobacterium LF-bin-369]
MKIDLDNSTDDAQIQILPLIDVIFCILTFFIMAVVQLQRPQGVNVDIPKAETGTVQPPDRLIVTLSPTGQTFLGSEEVDRNTLADKARKYLDSKPDGLVVLNASQNAFYSDVISILDLMRKIGGNRVALATNPATTPTPTPTVPGPSLGIPGYSNPYGNPGLNPTNPLNPGLNPNPLNPGLNNPGLNNPSLLNPGAANPGSPGLSPSGIQVNPINPTPLVPGTGPIEGSPSQQPPQQ